ncbi:MAG: TIGR00304 family protein [Methanosarcinaceae archaeon]|nr:TIGR00304 family protein [Methanosarcinaceae archaeon]
MIGSILLSFGMLMILLGFVVIALGLLTAVSRQKKSEYEQGTAQSEFWVEKNEKNRTDVKGGGIIMIGPIPIIFGTDRHITETLIILAIILMLFIYLVF